MCCKMHSYKQHSLQTLHQHNSCSPVQTNKSAHKVYQPDTDVVADGAFALIDLKAYLGSCPLGRLHAACPAPALPAGWDRTQDP